MSTSTESDLIETEHLWIKLQGGRIVISRKDPFGHQLSKKLDEEEREATPAEIMQDKDVLTTSNMVGDVKALSVRTHQLTPQEMIALGEALIREGKFLS